MSMSLQPFLEFKHSVTVSVHETSSAKLTASVPNKRSTQKMEEITFIKIGSGSQNLNFTTAI